MPADYQPRGPLPDYTRAVDEEIGPLLAEIAAQLRERNEMIRAQRAESEQLRSEMAGKLLGGAPGSDPRATAVKRLEESRSRMESMADDAKSDRAERRAFQESLLEEIRRLNTNIEKLIADRS
jgi:hypothetical protein